MSCLSDVLRMQLFPVVFPWNTTFRSHRALIIFEFKGFRSRLVSRSFMQTLWNSKIKGFSGIRMSYGKFHQCKIKIRYCLEFYLRLGVALELCFSGYRVLKHLSSKLFTAVRPMLLRWGVRNLQQLHVSIGIAHPNHFRGVLSSEGLFQIWSLCDLQETQSLQAIFSYFANMIAIP